MGKSANHESASPPGWGEAREFTTTHWSVVVTAGSGSSPGARQALETLCRTYWYPLYASVRRRGHSPEDAQDLTQGFFARLLEKQTLTLADRERGRFRTFLLTALKNFVHTEWEKARAEKRGGAHILLSLEEQVAEGRYLAEPVEGITPDRLFEKRWAATLLELVMARLRDECRADGKGPLFDALAPHLWGEREGASYKEIAARLGMTESAVGVTVHRLRGRYRVLLRAEVAQTVATPSEVDDELRHLAALMSEPG
jgi:RNA polymerase sigma-70 factor (ECF subfamily)